MSRQFQADQGDLDFARSGGGRGDDDDGGSGGGGRVGERGEMRHGMSTACITSPQEMCPPSNPWHRWSVAVGITPLEVGGGGGKGAMAAAIALAGGECGGRGVMVVVLLQQVTVSRERLQPALHADNQPLCPLDSTPLGLSAAVENKNSQSPKDAFSSDFKPDAKFVSLSPWGGASPWGMRGSGGKSVGCGVLNLGISNLDPTGGNSQKAAF